MTEKSELKNTLRLKRLGVKVILNRMEYFTKTDAYFETIAKVIWQKKIKAF